MCGRYALNVQARILEEQFNAICRVELGPRYNIAPSQPALIVRASRDGYEAVYVRWGLIPSWAKDEKTGYSMFNAKSETAAEKNGFKHALRRRRCLVLATGFYEWKTPPKGKKVPHYIRVTDTEVFAFAGLWEHWQDPNGNEVESCTILTCAPNELMADIHDRMPVILPPESYARWLDPKNEDASSVRDLMVAYPAERMELWPVSSFVSNARNEGERCMEPAEPPGETGSLFG